MQPPREYKDLQKLTGCLASLRRFISKSGEQHREALAYEGTIILSVLEEPKDCRTHIAQYLVNGHLPDYAIEARKIKKRSFRTTPLHATGKTLFNLVYGSEIVLPAKAGLPTYRQMGFYEEENDHRMREQLNLADELRDQALYRM
ncbi:hypothetical protein LIER_29824 [Lithospermum erythrorhizon]|uniref:Uncharacterized protein n=1 Tax=Lithospermum erythrorhizon TaxID=34254 RepID=A0AAV3RP13_LITER